MRSFTVLIKTIPLRAENFAAFRASTLDDIAAICRLHTLTETVYLAPLAFLGLIGSKHSNTPRFVVESSRHAPAKIAHVGIYPHDMNLMYYSRRRKPVSRSFLRARHLRPLTLAAELGKHEPSRGSLQRAGHHDVQRLADVLPCAFYNDHCSIR